MSNMSYADNKVEAFQAIVFGVAEDASNKGLSHIVSYSNVSVDSLTLEEETSLVEIFASSDCWVLLKRSDSAAAVAIPSDLVKTKAKFVASDITYFMGIPRIDGITYKISVIRHAADGALRITEGA